MPDLDAFIPRVPPLTSSLALSCSRSLKLLSPPIPSLFFSPAPFCSQALVKQQLMPSPLQQLLLHPSPLPLPHLQALAIRPCNSCPPCPPLTS
eukprot:scaffold209428_cov13-Tisochrysis_lutea.AAC.1